MKIKYQTLSIAALLWLTSLAPGVAGQRTRTVSDPAEVDDEIRYLCTALAAGSE